MNQDYIKPDIIEEGFDAESVKSSESYSALVTVQWDNANFEESYSGDTFREVILQEYTIRTN
jgi:hypothetical protein